MSGVMNCNGLYYLSAINPENNQIHYEDQFTTFLYFTAKQRFFHGSPFNKNILAIAKKRV
jgi:hypothetical protein